VWSETARGHRPHSHLPPKAPISLSTPPPPRIAARGSPAPPSRAAARPRLLAPYPHFSSLSSNFQLPQRSDLVPMELEGVVTELGGARLPMGRRLTPRLELMLASSTSYGGRPALSRFVVLCPGLTQSTPASSFFLPASSAGPQGHHRAYLSSIKLLWIQIYSVVCDFVHQFLVKNLILSRIFPCLYVRAYVHCTVSWTSIDV
jgi:hypothetical protein